jgi:heptosyltransferase I
MGFPGSAVARCGPFSDLGVRTSFGSRGSDLGFAVKILILKPSSLGDVIQALPVLRLIKRQLPAAEVYWWIESGLASLLEGDPDLAGIVRFERRRWAVPINWPEMARSITWMRRQQFDWVIDLQCLARSGAFAWLANGKLLVGLDEPREGARGYYDLAVRRPSYHTHAVDWYLAVLPRLGIPVCTDFDWLPSRPRIAEDVRRRWPANGERWVALQAGARWLNKRWPAAHFAELVRLLAAGVADRNLKFAILGGVEDKALAQAIATAAPDRCLDLSGKLSLPEMVEWIRRCELMVSNDTGPMHVAAALKKPMVALFGPTEPRRTGPYGQLENVLQLNLPCVPCMKPRCRNATYLECLESLSPAVVAARVRALLDQARR